jgi:ADP-ribose pyrophosphatase YjhB (NUDIX family)
MENNIKQIKNSVAFVIYNSDRSKFLIVRRPVDDNNFPNVWSLPAGTLLNNETFEDAVIRSLNDKLGVEGEIIKLIGEGEIERDKYILHMKEFEVIIKNGTPSVPQTKSGITQYTEWKWGIADDLIDAVSKGALCSRLYLESINKSW